MPRKFTINTPLVSAYGFLFFCMSLLNNIFLVYHVQAFVLVFKVSKVSFWLAESLFLVWNSLNDPLFGWLMDSRLLEASGSDCNIHQMVRQRARLISWFGPPYALFFALAWNSAWLPGLPGCRLVILLCGYDTALTVLELQLSAMLADLSISQVDRSLLGTAASLGQMTAASGLVLVTWWMDDLLGENQTPHSSEGSIAVQFRLLTFGLASLSCLGLWLVGYWLSTKADLLVRRSSAYQDTTASAEETSYLSLPDKGVESISTQDVSSYFSTKYRQDKDGENLNSLSPHLSHQNSKPKNLVVFIFRILHQRNFLIFSLVQVLQVFHCHFNSNFFPIFAKVLLGAERESLVCILLGTSFILPHLNNVILLQLSDTVGTYIIIKLLFVSKILLGFITFCYGSHNILFLSLFIASNRIFTEGVCKLLSQVISDLVDEDFALNRRSQPLSALIFGAGAFLGRPGQTFAPLFGFGLLSALAGQDLMGADNCSGLRHLGSAAINFDVPASTLPPSLALHQACFLLICLLATSLGCIQLVLWNYYDLRDLKLKRIKRIRLQTTSAAANQIDASLIV